MAKKKIEITAKQAEQFNEMRQVLRMIAGHKGERTNYMTSDQLREQAAKGDMGLDFEESLEMAYDNIQAHAKIAAHGVRAIVMEFEPVVYKKGDILKDGQNTYIAE